MAEADAPPASGVGNAVHVTFLGHATVAVDLCGTLLLTDPILRSHVTFLRWTAPAPRLDALDGVDAILISHLHHDHCDPRSLSLLGNSRTMLVPWGAEPFFRRRGFTDVVAMGPGETYAVGDVAVTATEAAHDGRREPFGPSAAAIGFVLACRGLSLYFAGDTGLFPRMRDLGADLDVALLPVAGWGTTLGPGHLDPIRAAEAARMLRPSLAVPIHWGGLQPVWHRPQPTHQAMAPATAFAAEVGRCRLPTDVTVLEPGSALTWHRSVRARRRT